MKRWTGDELPRRPRHPKRQRTPEARALLFVAVQDFVLTMLLVGVLDFLIMRLLPVPWWLELVVLWWVSHRFLGWWGRQLVRAEAELKLREELS